jgi:archaellum component FlaC
MTQKRTSEDSLMDLISVLISEMRQGQAATTEGFDRLTAAQAKTDASIERMSATIAESANRVDASIDRLSANIERLTDRVDLVSQNIAAMQVNEASRIEAQREIANQQSATVNRLVELVTHLTARN